MLIYAEGISVNKYKISRAFQFDIFQPINRYLIKIFHILIIIARINDIIFLRIFQRNCRQSLILNFDFRALTFKHLSSLSKSFEATRNFY